MSVLDADAAAINIMNNAEGYPSHSDGVKKLCLRRLLAAALQVHRIDVAMLIANALDKAWESVFDAANHDVLVDAARYAAIDEALTNLCACYKGHAGADALADAL